MTNRWATFDCYGTLIDWRGGIRDAVLRLWPQADADRLLRHHQVIEPVVQEGRSITYRNVLRRTLKAIAAIDDLDLAASDEYALADALPHWSVFPEVPQALQRLREQGWRLAILSNTDPDLLEASIASIGVPIDLRITAADAGSYKPAHGHWQRFFERSGAARDHHVHVAASLMHDIAPAAEQGLTAVWINRLSETSELPRAAELVDLSALPETLDRLVSSGAVTVS
jgi:2-haloacid dehalogenase